MNFSKNCDFSNFSQFLLGTLVRPVPLDLINSSKTWDFSNFLQFLEKLQKSHFSAGHPSTSFTTFCYCVQIWTYLVTLVWFSIQIIVNFKFSKLSWNISLSITGLKSPFNLQQAIWALKCGRERFNDGLKISTIKVFVWKTMQAWLEIVFLIQMLLTFGGRCNRCFWDIRLKRLTLPNFNMLFQLVLKKFLKSELFSCSPKIDHVITVITRA